MTRAATVPLSVHEVPATSEQLDLFALPLARVDLRGLSLDERFSKFIRANPHVYSAFVSTARDYLRRTGRDRVGAKACYERIRWEYSVRSADADFALNNSYVSRLARLAASLEPDLRSAFEFRSLRSSRAQYPIGAAPVAAASTEARTV